MTPEQRAPQALAGSAGADQVDTAGEPAGTPDGCLQDRPSDGSGAATRTPRARSVAAEVDRYLMTLRRRRVR